MSNDVAFGTPLPADNLGSIRAGGLFASSARSAVAMDTSRFERV